MESNNFLIETIVDALVLGGYEITQQRLRVIYGLCALGHIENAEELWLILKSKKRISRTTVYDCLNILVKMGYVKKGSSFIGGSSFRLSSNRVLL